MAGAIKCYCHAMNYIYIYARFFGVAYVIRINIVTNKNEFLENRPHIFCLPLYLDQNVFPFGFINYCYLFALLHRVVKVKIVVSI